MFFEAEKGGCLPYGQLFYRQTEWSIDFETDPRQGGADCSILVRDLNIDFDLSTKKAQAVWGYHPHTMWIPKKLFLPNAFPGNFILLNDIMEIQDVIRLEGTSAWETVYDSETGWLCVGDITLKEGDVAVKFLPDVIAILHTQQLKALWLKPLFV